MAPVSSLARRTAIGATWMVAWRMVTRLLGLASTLILARVLVPADFGLVAMATTFAAAVDALSQIGVQDALVRRRGEAAGLYDTAFSLQLGRAVLTAALLAVSTPAAVWWFDEPRLQPLLLVLAAGVVISGCENIGIIEFRRDLRFDRQFRLLAVPRLVQVGLSIPLALWLQSYWALPAGIIIGKLARTAMTYAVHPYRPRLRLAGWRDLAGFSFWTWATALASLIWDRCDPFVLGPSLGPARLGVYLLAAELATLPVSELIAPAADVLFAGFAAAQQQGVSSTRLAPTVAVSLFLLVLPLVIAISATSGYMVAALLGPHWAAAQTLVAILAWLCVFSSFSYVSTSVLVANGHVARNFVANVAASTIKLAVLVTAVALTDRLAVIAAATAACVAAESVVFITILKGTGEVRLRDMAGGMGRGLLAGALTVGVLAASGLGWRIVAMPAVPALLTGAAIGGLALAIFAATELLAWKMCGRPDGPEASIFRHLAGPLAARAAT